MTRTVRATALAVGAAATGAVAGFTASAWMGSSHVSRMLPWILGRGLGLAGYLTLVALTAFGLWLRHPWRSRWPHPSPEVALRIHAWLAASTLVLIVGHVVALVLDRYAGVGVAGAVIPGHATYRPFATALGTVSVYAGLLVGGSAALAGRIIGRSWRGLHRLAMFVFAAVWTHGVLAGSDTPRLRLMYVATGALVLAIGLTRRLARPSTAVLTPSPS